MDIQERYDYESLRFFEIPKSLLIEELGEYDKSVWLYDLSNVLECYKIYHNGAMFNYGNKDGSTPSLLSYKKSASLVNKEARFMFARTPEIVVSNVSKEEENEEVINEQLSTMQSLIDNVLAANSFKSKVLKAGKDCLIGKRVAIMLNFNEETGISVNFVPATNFVYEVSSVDGETLTKIVTYTLIRTSSNSSNKRIFAKKYEMKEDGFCYVTERMYDGAGREIDDYEGKLEEVKTLFEYIPAFVILNDSLSGDLFGSSEISSLQEYEAYYSKMANADMDAERKSMYPIYYTVDASSSSSKSIDTAPGAYWDLATDQNSEKASQAQVGVVEPSMNYSEALDKTLKRIEDNMYTELDVPNTSTENLQGVVSSGKTLKALYWGLIMRCDEKFLVWKPALRFMAETIIEGCMLYPKVAALYVQGFKVPAFEFEIEVENIYPIPEDETEEKQTDIAQVNAQVMSKKAYMIKWRGLTPKQADEELKQIALEKQLLEESFYPNDYTQGGQGGQQQEEEEDDQEQDEEEDFV